MTTSAPTATASLRYGQLTYTSVDGAGGAGGWRVKQNLGLDEAEVDALRARISTQLDLGFELPRFPSDEDVRGFPRRLVYAPVAPGSAAWWHTAPAGNDGSGR